MSDITDLKSPLSLEQLLSSLCPGSRVLDLGCGGGTFRYKDFPSLEIHALDEGIHPNVHKFPPNAHFVRAGASAIPEATAAFDLVVVNFAFEHFPEPVAALREIERVAKDRAFVWMSMPNAGSFEDQLYRNLFAGGGHLQSPTFESFVRLVYESTCLKLVSYMELPPGFTYLGESEELRHLTWAIIAALRKSVAIDACSRSAYIFVLRKHADHGPGFREYLRTCHACGTPDKMESNQPARQGGEQNKEWICPRCGVLNKYPSTLQAVRLDDVERAQRLQWERLPETNPARLRAMAEERGRWAQDLQRSLEATRQRNAELQAEIDKRGRWAQDLQHDLEAARKSNAELQAEIDKRGRWIQDLQRDLEATRLNITELQAEIDKRGQWVQDLQRDLEATRLNTSELQAEIDKRGRWAQGLQHDLDLARRHETDLQAEIDKRGRWALELQQGMDAERQHLKGLFTELAARDERIARLQAELDQCQKRAQELESEVRRLRQTLSELKHPLGLLKHLWKHVKPGGK